MPTSKQISPLAAGQRLGYILFGQQHRRAARHDRSNALQHLVDQLGCEPQRRFIEQQESRAPHERASDRQHLLLTAGELPAERRAALGEHRKQLKGVVHERRAAAGRTGDRHLQILAHGQAGKHPPPLGTVAEPEMGASFRTHVRQRLAGEADAARGRSEESHDRLEQRRLAGAVRANQRNRFAGVHRDSDIAERRDRVVAYVQPLDAEEALHAGVAGRAHAASPR